MLLTPRDELTEDKLLELDRVETLAQKLAFGAGLVMQKVGICSVGF